MARTNRRRENNVDDRLDRKRKLVSKTNRNRKKTDLKNIDIKNMSSEELEELDEYLDEY